MIDYTEEDRIIKAQPTFVEYESFACPICARIRWMLFSDGYHECEKCDYTDRPNSVWINGIRFANA